VVERGRDGYREGYMLFEVEKHNCGMPMLGQDNWDRTTFEEQPGQGNQDSQDRTTRTGQPEQFSWDRSASIGQLVKVSLDRDLNGF
jgi:hypothetical protein